MYVICMDKVEDARVDERKLLSERIVVYPIG